MTLHSCRCLIVWTVECHKREHTRHIVRIMASGTLSFYFRTILCHPHAIHISHYIVAPECNMRVVNHGGVGSWHAKFISRDILALDSNHRRKGREESGLHCLMTAVFRQQCKQYGFVTFRAWLTCTVRWASGA